MSEAQNYPLGYSAEEAKRLADQAAQVAEYSQEFLRRAGLRAGMQVLDIGCGVGDVSLLAARIVGSDGAVLGVDRASSSVGIARQRAESLGVENVFFEACELSAFATDRTFDAIIGRFVLSYIPECAMVLRRLAQHLRPGAVVAFQELDMSQIAQTPASDLFVKARGWVLDGFAAGGADLDMGAKLYATFLQAGLPAPSLTAVTPVSGGSGAGAYEQMVQALRSLAPVLEQNGIASVAEIGIDTLAERLREDATANGRVVFLSRIVGASARLA